eukprot:TRINITY_DN731_c0_g1_i3.p1 TRINITY_DN731_c0_g1~~TRINITY_DN731_c0_g1_i3.p1  ORF type:complete len:359 (+),score=35.91 TRINITY_DN731_c0_g1_i3:1952-3028(+)
MVPIYAIDSWLSLRFPREAILLETIRNCYEAYVIWSFMQLLKLYLGNDDDVSDVLCTKPPVAQLWPFNYCCAPSPLGRRFLYRCKQGTVQYVLIKPVTTTLAAIFMLTDLWDEGEFRYDRAYVYVTAIDCISVSVAMWYLVMFYMATKDLLEPHRPVPKFISVKAIIFMSFWQGVLFAMLRRFDVIRASTDFSADNVQTGLQDYLICIEMFIAAVAHKWVFPYKEYGHLPPQLNVYGRRVKFQQRVKSMLSMQDIVDDTKTIFKPLPPKTPAGKGKERDREAESDDDKSSPHLITESEMEGMTPLPRPSTQSSEAAGSRRTRLHAAPGSSVAMRTFSPRESAGNNGAGPSSERPDDRI